MVEGTSARSQASLPMRPSPERPGGLKYACQTMVSRSVSPVGGNARAHCSGFVGTPDLGEAMNTFGDVNSVAIPEPATLSLVAAALLLFVFRRRS